MNNHCLYKNVLTGKNFSIGHFVVIGIPPKDFDDGELKTHIGDNCIIRSHSVIYAGTSIDEGFQSGHGVMIREFNQIGKKVSIGTHSVIEHHVKIGNNVRIHSNAFIPEYSIIDDDAWIGPGVLFTNAKYPRSREVMENLVGPKICSGAKIGAGVIVLPGVEIGMNALIGAGAVVVNDVPPGKVIIGNPGRSINEISRIKAYEEKI